MLKCTLYTGHAGFAVKGGREGGTREVEAIKSQPVQWLRIESREESFLSRTDDGLCPFARFLASTRLRIV